MARARSSDQETLGAIILDRLASDTIPPALRPLVTAFKSAQASLAAAAKATEAARSARDDALGAVTVADRALDDAVLALHDKMIGAGVGARRNPFAGFTKYPASKLTQLAYADEVKEVLGLTAKVAKAKPPADVVKAVKACERLAAGVESALAKVSKPQLAYQKALATRDGLLPAWTKALDQLKKNAAVVWFESPGTYKAVFAPPTVVQAPAHPKAKKPAQAAGSSTAGAAAGATATAGGATAGLGKV